MRNQNRLWFRRDLLVLHRKLLHHADATKLTEPGGIDMIVNPADRRVARIEHDIAFKR